MNRNLNFKLKSRICLGLFIISVIGLMIGTIILIVNSIGTDDYELAMTSITIILTCIIFFFGSILWMLYLYYPNIVSFLENIGKKK